MRSIIATAERELETITKRHTEELKQMIVNCELARKLEPIVQELDESFLTYFYVSRWSLTLYVSVDGFLSEVSPELIDLIEKIETIVGKDATSYDVADANCRIYRIGEVEIYAEPRDNGACNRVVVGSKKETRSTNYEIEVPVYEFRC